MQHYIKRQLRAYYAMKGVGRRRAEKLVKSDYASLVRQRVQQGHGAIHLTSSVGSAVIWSDTVEGHWYWLARDIYL